MRTEDDEDMLRDNTTFAIGLRGHFKLSDTIWIRPGLAYALPTRRSDERRRTTTSSSSTFRCIF